MQNSDISKAVKALSNGKIIVYPTDTLYGLGADIFNIDAVEKIFEIKKRVKSEPLSVAVSSFSELEKIAFVDDKIKKIVDKFLPGKLTIILEKRDIVPDLVTGGLNKVGVRIPNNKIAMDILHEFGPITSTSANVHGQKTPITIEDVSQQFKEDVTVYLDDGCLNGKASTIIDATSSDLRIIREGEIAKDKIMDMINYE